MPIGFAGSLLGRVWGSGGTAPIVVSITPNVGSPAGGETRTIAGSGFTGADAVYIDGNACPSFTVNSDIEIEAEMPAGSGSGLSVEVHTPLGFSGVNTLYSYAAAPVVTGAQPASAAERTDSNKYTSTGLQDPVGGTEIYIVGSDFVSGIGLSVDFYQAAVLIGSASLVTFVNGSTLTATTPALPLGTYDIVVTNPDAQTSGASGNGLHISFDMSVYVPGALLLPGTYDPDGVSAGVGRWPDASGNANHADASAAIESPASSGGNPVFDGTDDALTISESLVVGQETVAAMASAAAGSIVAFLRTAQTNDEGSPVTYDQRCILSGDGASPNFSHVSAGLRANAYDENGSNNYNNAIAATPCSVGEAHVGVMTWNAAQIRAILDGDVAGATATAQTGGTGIPDTGNTGPSTFIGRSYGGTRYKGEMIMIAIYAVELNDAQIKMIREWGVIKGYVDGVFFEPSQDATVYTWHRGDTATYLAGAPTTEIDQLQDKSGVDANKYLNATGALPKWDAADANFGGQPSWGDDYAADTVSWMISGAFATPLEAPFTRYDVVRIITDTGGQAKYVAINYGGGSLGAAIYGGPGAQVATTNGANQIACDPGIDVTSVIGVVYNGVSSASYVNVYDTPTASGDTGSGLTVDGFSYVSLGTGSYPGEAGRFRQAEKIVCSGAHDLATRRKYMGYLAARYKLPLST